MALETVRDTYMVRTTYVQRFSLLTVWTLDYTISQFEIFRIDVLQLMGSSLNMCSVISATLHVLCPFHNLYFSDPVQKFSYFYLGLRFCF